MKTTIYLKKIISILLLQISFQNVSFSQEKYPKFHFGVFAGVSSSKVISQDLGNIYAPISSLISRFEVNDLKHRFPFGKMYNWTASYNFGANIDLQISKSIYFESGLTFISKKAVALPVEFTSLTINSYKDAIFVSYQKHYESKSDYESNAIQIPISLNFILYQKNNFKSNIHFGVFWENMFYHKTLVSLTSYWTPNIPSSEFSDDAAKLENKISLFKIDDNDEDFFVKKNVGYTVGLGFSIKKMGLDFSYNIPDRAYGSVQYQVPSFITNLHYQIK